MNNMPDSEYCEMIEYVPGGWGGGPSNPMVTVPWPKQWPTRQKRAKAAGATRLPPQGVIGKARFIFRFVAFITVVAFVLYLTFTA